MEVKEIKEDNPEIGVELRLKPSKDWPKKKRRAIQSIKQTKWGFEFKLHGKDAQITNLFKHFGLFKDEASSPASTSNLIEAIKGEMGKIWDE